MHAKPMCSSHSCTESLSGNVCTYGRGACAAVYDDAAALPAQRGVGRQMMHQADQARQRCHF